MVEVCSSVEVFATFFLPRFHNAGALLLSIDVKKEVVCLNGTELHLAGKSSNNPHKVITTRLYLGGEICHLMGRHNS